MIVPLTEDQAAMILYKYLHAKACDNCGAEPETSERAVLGDVCTTRMTDDMRKNSIVVKYLCLPCGRAVRDALSARAGA